MTLPIFTTFILLRVLIDYTLIECYKIDLKGIYKAITATITIIVCIYLVMIIYCYLVHYC
jgi:hypothetical protein